MITLPALECPNCHGSIASVDFDAKRSAAAEFKDCLRKCAVCEIGASNTTDTNTVTFIYANPIESIPSASRQGAAEALANALNIRNHPSKWIKFGFVPTSEDAVTWVVFTYLLRAGKLLGALQRLGLSPQHSHTAPTLLLWGVPIDDHGRGEPIRKQLIELCTGLGEEARSFSEPDVIIDLAEDGLVFIEVKYRSGNDFKDKNYPGWKKYLSTSALAWDAGEVQASGCYELARNWCLLNGLAAGRRATLLNLGPPSLSSGEAGKQLDRFIGSLNANQRCSFRKLTWSEFLGGDTNDAPRWFADFCRERRLSN
jgi:hypothetical protein